MGQVEKKSSSGGSKFKRELRKLECSISYKTNLSGGRRGRNFFWELVEVSMKLRFFSWNVRGG